MVCGASGLGKSTLINSLFLTDVYSAVSNIKKPKLLNNIQKFSGVPGSLTKNKKDVES